MPSSFAEDCGGDMGTHRRKVEIFSQPQKATYSFQQQKVRSLVSLVYFKDHLHIETLVFFFFCTSFGMIVKPSDPRPQIFLQDECSGVAAEERD